MLFIGQIISWFMKMFMGQAMKNPAILAGLGGMLAKGGLSNILGKLQGAGMGDMVKGWIAKGPNPAISTSQLTGALGEDEVASMARKAGVPKDQFADALAQHLPSVVDKLSPNGTLPSADEIDSNLGNAEWWK